MATMQKRRKFIMVLAGAALVSCALGWASGLNGRAPRAAALIGRIVVPEFEADVTDVSLVHVTTKDESYQLSRETEGWVLLERGRYPIRLDALADLSEALSAMTYAREMTHDPRKFDSLGLGDPTDGGLGALMEVTNTTGEKVVELIVGFKNGAAYVRHPGEEMSWAVDTSVFPPLQNPARWLDLNVMSLEVEDIERVELSFASGEPYALDVSPNAPGKFSLAPPHDNWRMVSGYAANPVALALTRFTPVDVAPRAEMGGAYVATLRTLTHWGLAVDAELFQDNDRYWVVFSEGLEAETDQAAAALEAIESRVAGWAFEISGLDFNLMTTPLAGLATPVAAMTGPGNSPQR